jgi:hypothetical protein
MGYQAPEGRDIGNINPTYLLFFSPSGAQYRLLLKNINITPLWG